MIKAVLFDVDGVLIDSVEVGLRVRKKLLAHYGVNLDLVPDSQGEGHRAASMKTLLASVESHHGLHINPDEFAKLSTEHMNQELQKSITSADPGLVIFLNELQSHGVLCAVASSSLQEGVNNKLKILGIRQYFSVIITGSDTQKHKPHPDAYLLAMAALHLSPEDCIVFEDTIAGVKAGIAAGCRVVGFTQYNPPKEPLPGVVMTVENWKDISYDRLLRLV